MVDCRTLFDTLPGVQKYIQIRDSIPCTTGNFEYWFESLIANIIAVRIELH